MLFFLIVEFKIFSKARPSTLLNLMVFFIPTVIISTRSIKKLITILEKFLIASLVSARFYIYDTFNKFQLNGIGAKCRILFRKRQ